VPGASSSDGRFSRKAVVEARPRPARADALFPDAARAGLDERAAKPCHGELQRWFPARGRYTDDGRANYRVQLDLRIIPKCGDHQLRHRRTGPIESWVPQPESRRGRPADPQDADRVPVDPQACRARRGDRAQPDSAGGAAEAGAHARTAADRAFLRRADPPAHARPDARARGARPAARSSSGARPAPRRHAGEPARLLGAPPGVRGAAASVVRGTQRAGGRARTRNKPSTCLDPYGRACSRSSTPLCAARPPR
jgi:hypothetical protein